MFDCPNLVVAVSACSCVCVSVSACVCTLKKLIQHNPIDAHRKKPAYGTWKSAFCRTFSGNLVAVNHVTLANAPFLFRT